MVYEILQETPIADIQGEKAEGGFFIEKVTPELADAFVRLMKILENNDELKILAPSIIREIHYRLLLSRFGTKIRSWEWSGVKHKR